MHGRSRNPGIFQYFDTFGNPLKNRHFNVSQGRLSTYLPSRNAQMISSPPPGKKTSLERLGALIFDAIVNLDPGEFDAITDAVARFKTEDQASYSALMNGGCMEFATLFGAIEQAVSGLK